MCGTFDWVGQEVDIFLGGITLNEMGREHDHRTATSLGLQ